MTAATLERLAHAFPGCALTNLYGQTEAGPGGTVCKPEHILAKAGSIGNQGAGPWTSFEVQDDDGRRSRPGVLGEIVLRSPAVMRGYRDDPAQTAATLAGGWLHTGDLGFVDEDGFLFYADRRKDLVIRGGMNVASAEVESVLMSYPGIADVAVIGVEHDVLGEDLLAVVVAPDGIDTDELFASRADAARRLQDTAASSLRRRPASQQHGEGAQAGAPRATGERVTDASRRPDTTDSDLRPAARACPWARSRCPRRWRARSRACPTPRRSWGATPASRTGTSTTGSGGPLRR